jgi:hypothetical protein
MSAASSKVNVFNPAGTKKEGPSFQSSKPSCPLGPAPRQRFDRVQNPDGTWKSVTTGGWTCEGIVCERVSQFL